MHVHVHVESNMASGHQLTLFQCVDSQRSSTKRVKLVQEEDDRSSSSDGDISPVIGEGSSASESDSEDLCVDGETSLHPVSQLPVTILLLRTPLALLL